MFRLLVGTKFHESPD